jgi:hypothetical protein
MAFSDPITYDLVGDDNNVLNKYEVGSNSTSFRSADQTIDLSISHSYGKRTRSALKLKWSDTVQSLYTSDEFVPVDMSVTLVIDTPKLPLITDAQKKIVAKSLLAYLGLSSYAVLDKVIEGQV